MSADNRAFGRCLCGAVKFLVTLPPRFCVHCHCHTCRLMHGAAFVTWLGVPAPHLKLAGREHLKWYVGSPVAKRGFCDVCGTPMLFMSTEWPGEVHVTRASILDQAEITPRFHIYYDQRVDWFPFDDALPHLGGKKGTDPLGS
jgi:hypothetical protein